MLVSWDDLASTTILCMHHRSGHNRTAPVWYCSFLQFKEYLSRAEYIKSVIDGQVPAVQAQNGTGQKARGPGGGGGGNDKDAVRLWCCAGAL